ncbi:Uncharacterized protein OBRU01_26469, partial [Operophtera brumata]
MIHSCPEQPTEDCWWFRDYHQPVPHHRLSAVLMELECL